eukprot:Blabericola_migrator_1__9353@NODE_503_length_7967_cov_321_558608_g385_i0_p3_GENE_NODE_503_length_7967_cov_321_558608_g385_i0NODE_503_length_7967_cov_321_558608_g385_i0_p3_ORF_typecomplete_len153_score42_61_NODE_503_length_7967_cov_321_558608_g385_i016252083
MHFTTTAFPLILATRAQDILATNAQDIWTIVDVATFQEKMEESPDQDLDYFDLFAIRDVFADLDPDAAVMEAQNIIAGVNTHFDWRQGPRDLRLKTLEVDLPDAGPDPKFLILKSGVRMCDQGRQGWNEGFFSTEEDVSDFESQRLTCTSCS